MSKPIDDFLKDQLSKDISDQDLIKALKSGRLNMNELAERFKVPLLTVRKAIERITDRQVLVRYDGESYTIMDFPEIGGRVKLDVEYWQGKTLKIGFCSDNHLCNKYARPEVLNGLYDLFAKREVLIVMNCGNYIDGEAKFNRNDLHVFGFDNQVEYFVANYPYREHVKTWFIDGADHEGWYTNREGISTGKHVEMLRQKNGMNDLRYMGFIEADVELHKGQYEFDCWTRLMHPGGGSAYAYSYKPQKIIESLEGGEKPSIQFIGHYHKQTYNDIRNVHTVQVGTTESQTPWMRRQHIDAHVGGGYCEVIIGEDGLITEFVPHFFRYYDRKFYEGVDKYWKKVSP